MRDGGEAVANLGGWLASIAHRRAVDDARAEMRHRARTAAYATVAAEHGVGGALDDELDDRSAWHQWLVSVRLRLGPREQQAISLSVLHDLPRNEVSDVMGVSLKRLDKILTTANKKLGGLLETIRRGEWCEDQRSLITAYAFELHEAGSERQRLAAAHLSRCPACAAYVRALRGIAVVVPAPTGGLDVIATAGGGLVGAGVVKGTTAGAGGAAAGGGLLSTVASKTAVICVSAACAAGGVVVVESVPDSEPHKPRPTARAPVRTTPVASPTPRTAKATTRPSPKTEATSSSSPRRRTLDPNSQAARQLTELGPESGASSVSAPAAPPPPPAGGGEFVP